MDPVLGTVVAATAAGVALGAAAVAPLRPRQRLVLAVLGAGLDWIPLAFGWMSIAVDPSPLFLRAHLGFGTAGYAVLAACAVDWVRGVERPRPMRLAYLSLWAVGYLAGVGMVWSAVR